MKNKITIKQFFENQILNKQASPELVRYKKYQLAVRDNCLRICKNRNIKVDKLQIPKHQFGVGDDSLIAHLTKTKSVYLFDESIIKEVVAAEIQIGKPRGRHVKRKIKNQ